MIDHKQYYLDNRDKLRDYNKQYRIDNGDKLRASGRQRRIDNGDRQRAYDKQYYLDNKDILREKARQYYLDNRDERLAYQLQRQRRDPAKVNALVRKRRAIKLHAMPEWLSKIQIEQILEFYNKAHQMNEETGIKHNVDHIIPLQGKNVCGLNVPWNLQVLTAEENLSKGNKIMREIV